MIQNKPLITASLSGVCLGLAFTWPATISAALFGWLACLLLAFLVYLSPNRLALFLVGVISHLIAFHWLLDTIAKFGGFGFFSASLIFLAFTFTAALQFIIFGWIFKKLPLILKESGLALPMAWCTVEYFYPRIFPWEFGHSQIAFSHLIQSSDIFGSQVVSFMLFWLAGAACLVITIRPTRLRVIHSIPIVVLIANLFYGAHTISFYKNIQSQTHRVSVIQANISIEDKHNQLFFEKNTEQYKRLTATLADDGRLIIWPETVITDWVNNRIKSSEQDAHLPQPTGKNSFLVGALTLTPKSGEIDDIYNSAVAINATGAIEGFYHKQILMPFGEYMPFASTFPWLLDVAHMQGQFTAGKEIKVFNLGLGIKASTLICYEDLVADLSISAINQGANLLINITNDAWFGNSSAPHVHNAIASFRAIENRRYLIRSTNSGLTAVINSLGTSEITLTPYSEGIITTEVKLLEGHTIFNKYIGTKLWLFLSSLTLILSLVPLYKPLRQTKNSR